MGSIGQSLPMAFASVPCDGTAVSGLAGAVWAGRSG